jgi:hypothetical protein
MASTSTARARATDPAAGDELLAIEGIRKEFPGVVALDNVQFRLKRSTVHLLEAGAYLRFVQDRDWLGHSNVQNTVVYTFLTTRSREGTDARSSICSLTDARSSRA